MNHTISHGGDASYKVNNAIVANQMAKANQCVTHTFDYLFGGMGPDQIIKTRWVNGKIDATFQCDIEALPDFLTNLVFAFYREKYNCEIGAKDFSKAVTEWVEWADEGYLQRKPIALKWIRTSLDNGEIYCLTVPADATVCENCDIVLGNYSADDIFQAAKEYFQAGFQADAVNRFIVNGVIRWGVHFSEFFGNLMVSLSTFTAVPKSVIDNAPESEWTTFCKDWNELVYCKIERICPRPNDEKVWNFIYDRLSN